MRLLVLLLVMSADAPKATSVGFAERIKDVYIPGLPVEVKPLTDRKTPVIVRIVRSEPVDKGYRYELEYIGLEPGTFDLRPYLHRADRADIDKLPELRVTIESVLAPGHVLPNDLKAKATPRPGGYSLLLIAGGVVWAMGLFAILFLWRGRRKQAANAKAPRSLADHLRPLVEAALAGRAQTTQLADLERSLIRFWTRKLGLAKERPVEALGILRKDPQAGPLLVQLETWLHRPERTATIDLSKLLEPYRQLPPDALEVATSA